jgi:hypothetical protein
MQTSQRCNNERSHPTWEAWYDGDEKRSLEIKQVSRGCTEREEMKKKKTLANVDQTPSHAVNVVCRQHVVNIADVSNQGIERVGALKDWPGPRFQASTEGDRVSHTDVFCLCERCVLCCKPCVPPEAPEAAVRCA